VGCEKICEANARTASQTHRYVGYAYLFSYVKYFKGEYPSIDVDTPVKNYFARQNMIVPRKLETAWFISFPYSFSCFSLSVRVT